MILLVAVTTGLVTGILSGLLGIGGGAILVASSVFFLGLGQHVAQGAAIAATIPTALVGVLRHHRNRLIAYDVAAWLAAGVLLGGFSGSYVANLLSDDILRKLFSAFFAVMSIQMFWTSRKPTRKESAEETKKPGEDDPARQP